MLVTNTLRWLRQTTTEDGFRIYRDTSPINTSNLPPVYATLPPGATEFIDELMVVDQEYHYVVSVFKGEVEKFSEPYHFDKKISATGPGSGELIGHNDTAGFFGEVSGNDLISGSDLTSLVGIGGSDLYPSEPWLKFFLDNKILFVAKKSFRYNVNWSNLATPNLITGNRILTIGNYRYRIRLIKGLGSSGVEFVDNTHDHPSTHGSEWNRLMYNVTVDHTDPMYQKKSQIGSNWGNYLQGSTSNGIHVVSGNGSATWCQDEGMYITRGGSSSVTYARKYSGSTSGSAFGWRPVLELVTT